MKAGHNQTKTAAVIGVYKVTAYHELRRNRGQRGYRPKQGQQLEQTRRQASPQPRIRAGIWCQVEGWAAGRMES